jgi:FkbM family methyltransferase
MLETGTTYPKAKLPANVLTFADLGCNVGYFTCWLAHLAEGRPLKGLMIDANAEVVKEALWHARANRWKEVFAIQGIAGGPSQGGEADFFVFSSSHCSATGRNPLLSGAWKRMRVPCVAVERLWRQQFSEQRCQLLKVDIEGSELDFFRAESPFLRLVDAVLVEWHKWRVQFDEVRLLLTASGFERFEILDEKEREGTCLFQRS